MRALTPDDVHDLFDRIFPKMDRAPAHRDECVAQLKAINELLAKYHDDANRALPALLSLKGIGPVIASGLLHESDPEHLVPFDKYTMGLALRLHLVRDHVITTGRYVAACQAVLEYLKNDGRPGDILGFVREAGELDTLLAQPPA